MNSEQTKHSNKHFFQNTMLFKSIKSISNKRNNFSKKLYIALLRLFIIHTVPWWPQNDSHNNYDEKQLWSKWKKYKLKINNDWLCFNW